MHRTTQRLQQMLQVSLESWITSTRQPSSQNFSDLGGQGNQNRISFSWLGTRPRNGLPQLDHYSKLTLNTTIDISCSPPANLTFQRLPCPLLPKTS